MTKKTLFPVLFLGICIGLVTTNAQNVRRQCLPGTPQNNVTLSKGIVAGDYSKLGEVKHVQDCVNKVCKLGQGDRAYILGEICYLVKCFSELSCEIAPLPYNDDLRSVVVAMKWKEVPVAMTETPTTTTTPTVVSTTTSTVPPTATPLRGPDGKIAKSAEHRLLQDLIYSSSYDREVRPVLNNEDQLRVFFELKLVQIVDVSSKAENVRVNVWTTQQWKDPFLQWNPTEYDGIDTINVEPNMVWLPIIILYNNVAGGFAGGPEKYKTKLVIDSNGTVKWFAATQFLFSCKINIRYFPFDEQYCYMTFGSWTYSTKHMDMLTTQVTADMSSYIVNGEWHVVKTPVDARKVLYPCCSDTFSDITYTFHIKRKVAYYVFNLIIPPTMIVVFALIGFCLPPDSGERIALNITVLLSMTVFLNIASNTLPSTSDSIPLLGYFYAIIMLDVCFAIVVTTVVLRYNYCGQTRMPERMRVIINEWIASMLFFFITTKPKGKGISKCFGGSSDTMFNLVESCRLAPNDENVTLQSYVVQREDNINYERIASMSSTTPTQRRNTHQFKQIATQPVKWRSEPSINLPGVALETKVHRRKVSLVPRRVNINNIIQNRIAEGLDVLTKRVKEESDKDDIILEWQFAATVLDRLFFMIFSVIMSIPLLVFFCSSPENQPPPIIIK